MTKEELHVSQKSVTEPEIALKLAKIKILLHNREAWARVWGKDCR